MSQKHLFQPLELRPFDRLDIPGLSTEEPRALDDEISHVSNEGPKGSATKLGFSTSYDSASYGRMTDITGRRLPAEDESLRTSFLQRKSRRFGKLWANAGLAVFTSAFVIWYSYRVMVDKNALPAALELRPGNTVLVVNILSHVVAYLCWTLVSDTMEEMRWVMACRSQGVLLTSFLALSRATPLVGVTYLCKTKGPHQKWAIQRYGNVY